MNQKLFFYSIFSFFLSIFLLKILLPTFKKIFLDKPNTRSSHVNATPSGGGIVFVSLGSLLSYQFNLIGPLICIPLSIVGFLDDKYDLPPKKRLLFQLLTSTILISVSTLFINIKSYSSIPIQIALYFLLLFLSIFIINIFNFMDGLDGLLSSCIFIILLAFGIKNDLGIMPLCFSLLAFIFFNWSPAKIFMGDGGSTFLGGVFVYICLKESTLLGGLNILLTSTPLLADTGICLLKRLSLGHPITKAHRLHLFQRLYLAGWSHSKISLIYMFSTLLISISYLFGDIYTSLIFAIIVVAFGFLLNKYFAKPFMEVFNQP